jgi:hypothetical protein
LQIFLITGLLSNKHDRRVRASFAKNSLRGFAPKIAIAAVLCILG